MIKMGASSKSVLAQNLFLRWLPGIIALTDKTSRARQGMPPKPVVDSHGII